MILLPDRTVIRLAGDDRKSFLQGLVTNDVNKLTPENPLYALMLSPQGKVLFDFFMVEQGEEIWLDCWREKAQELLQKLTMYKLRAKVSPVWDEGLKVYAGFGIQDLGFSDPRNAGLGKRAVIPAKAGISPHTPETPAFAGVTAEFLSYEHRRLSLGIPDSVDFIPDRSFAMEFGIADLHGISYTKGCYVGQEVMARSKTRGVLNKALYQISAESLLPACGTPVMWGDAEIGQLRSTQGNIGLAILRREESFDSHPLTAEGIPLTAKMPDWFSVPTPVTY